MTRTLYRIWTPQGWHWHRQGRISRPVCRRYTEPTAFVTAAWLAAQWNEDRLVEDPAQGLVWIVTSGGEVR